MSLARLMKFREVFLLLGAALMAVLFWCVSPDIDKVVLHRQGVAAETALPISMSMNEGEPFFVEMDIAPGAGSNFMLDIHPDDCVTDLRVNGVRLPYRDYPGYCSWNQGFILDKAEILKHLGKEPTRYHIEISMHNNGGLGGVNAVMKASGFLMSLLTVLFFLCVGGMLFSVGARFNIDRRLILIFFLGLLLRVGYTQATFYDERGHDVGGHVHYMKIIAEDHHIPASNECWTCYHPPVYYIASAGVWNLSNWFGGTPQDAVKWFDFLISLVALAFGIACIKNSLWGMPRYVAALLWSIWPSFILASPRLGNDILFYAMHIVALWGCIRYIKTGMGKYMLTAVIAAAAAYWTKSTAVVTFGLIGVTVLVQTLPRFLRGLSRLEWASLALLLIAGVVVLIRVLGGDVVGNAGGNDNTVLIKNLPGNFLFFDIRTFLTQPYTDPWHDNLGRQFFWNYLAKTSLFGEFKLLMTPAGQWLASLVSASFLVLLGFGLRGLWKSRWTKVQVLLAAQALFFFAAMIALRLKYPFSCSNDFRYIVPVLLSCLPWVAEGIAGDSASVKSKSLGLLAVVVFVVCSSVLIMSL